MGWLEEQIKQRNENDNQVFNDSFLRVANSVTGKKEFTNLFDMSQDAINTIFAYYRCSTKNEIPSTLKTFNEQLDYLCTKVGLASREVKIVDEWYKDCIGAILAFRKEDGSPVALIPVVGGYKFLKDGKYVRINKKNAKDFEMYAYCFYKAFPNRKISTIDLVKFAFGSISARSIVFLALLLMTITLIGLLLPKISYFLYGKVVEQKSIALLVTTMLFFFAVTVSKLLFNTYKTMYQTIISTNMNMSVQAASMMRVLSLPPTFFRKYSSGELSSRMGYVNTLCVSLMNLLFNSCFTSVFSLVYIASIFEYAPSLVIPSIIVVVITVGFSLLTTFVQNKITKENMEVQAKESGISFSMLTGIRKIRLAGAEKRMFARWADKYSESVKLTYNPPKFLKYNSLFSLIITLSGTIVMYFFAIKSNVDLAEYYAFTTAYGLVFSAFSSLASVATTSLTIKPILEMAKPLMEEEPEIYENKEVVTKLSGNIELNNVCFRYNDTMPNVVDNLSLKFKPGQYVAIVGKTGCGKSTLIRLLLGFEKCQKGSIYYDGKDISSLDVKSLRRNIGVVMQDGKLFQGEIFSNIAICAPDLTIEQAFEAADIAGIGDDIRNMPMGMNTLITDGGGGISGGQRQRLLIARAIAPKPSILIFDEATSALDNVTQKKVSDALDKLNCTRILIAHRLFTIKHCDRIIYLEDGKIKEDGTYEELIQKNGLFAELVSRQMLDNN